MAAQNVVSFTNGMAIVVFTFTSGVYSNPVSFCQFDTVWDLLGEMRLAYEHFCEDYLDPIP